MKLIGSLTSPYVRKVRIVLSEKKIDYKFELENVWQPDTHIQNYNPLGKVPCLIMEDGGAVFDSRVIVEYLDTISPVARLIPASGRSRVEVRCWEALADGLLDAAVAVRLEKLRPIEKQEQSWLDRQYKKIHAALTAMSNGLAGKPFCTGVSYNLADLATGTALCYLDFSFPELDWRSAHPNLDKLSLKLVARQSFLDTRPEE